MFLFSHVTNSLILIQEIEDLQMAERMQQTELEYSGVALKELEKQRESRERTKSAISAECNQKASDATGIAMIEADLKSSL